MCGIFGYSLSSNAYSSSRWNEFARYSLSHRGPDGSGVVQNDEHGFGLVHTRLSIQDLSPSGQQPMHSPDNTVILVFNGEIYNFRELRTELKLAGYHFTGQSDTEVLLALYLSTRDDISKSSYEVPMSRMLRRLNGIFAFAIWDFKFHSIFIARDAFGVKPLYVHPNRFGVFFASEIKAIQLVNPELDFASLDRYLSFLWCPGNGTPLNNVFSLGPGELMCISTGDIKSKSDWFHIPSSSPNCKEDLHLSRKSSIFGVESYLREAVHRQMVSDVPVGAFLSGGLDSSSVVAFAREVSPEINCFTIDIAGIGNDGFSDDLPYARRVAKHLKVPLDIVHVDAAQMASGIERMVWQLDEPLADPAPLNVMLISLLARKQGIKVLLSGNGGDDLFSGYRRHLALNNEIFWNWLPRSARILLRDLTGRLPNSSSHFRRLSKLFSGAHLGGNERIVNYFKWINRADLQALYTPEFLSCLGHARASDPMLDYLSELPEGTSRLERMLALEQRFFLIDHNLNYTDKMSMAAGVEVRVPFLDLNLVEFARHIPSKFKQRGRHGKWVLKKAMEPYLPKDVIYRSKSGFGGPLRRWLQTDLRDWLDDVLSVDRLQRRGLFDAKAVHRLIAANADGRIDASYTLFSLACIEIWCNYFIDGIPSPPPIEQ